MKTEYVSVYREDAERVEEVPLRNYIGEIQQKVDLAIHSTNNEQIKSDLYVAYRSLEATRLG